MARGEWVQPEGQRPSTAPPNGRLLGKKPRGDFGPPPLKIDLSWSESQSASNSPATQRKTPSSARNPITDGADSPFRSSVRSFELASSPEHHWKSSRAGKAPASPSPIVGTPGDRPSHLLTVHGPGGSVAVSGQNRVHRKPVQDVPAAGSTLEFGASSPDQSRPMRKAAPPPSNDLAGSPTPRGEKPRGPKQVIDRPQDNKETVTTRSKQFSEYSHLNKKRDPLGQYGYQGVESETFKPQIKRTEYSNTSHIEAGTICTWRDTVAGQPSPRTRCMATGDANPVAQSTAARTMGYGDAQGAGEGRPRYARPQSAAARDHVSEVIAHKPAEGISPRERMIASRAEQKSNLGGGSSEHFNATVRDNAQAFANNRARLTGGNNIFGGFLYEQK